MPQVKSHNPYTRVAIPDSYARAIYGKDITFPDAHAALPSSSCAIVVSPFSSNHAYGPHSLRLFSQLDWSNVNLEIRDTLTHLSTNKRQAQITSARPDKIAP